MQAVKNLIKTRYSAFMWRSGLLGAWLKVRPHRHKAVILNYHNPPADVFEDHLRSLVQAYRVVTLDRCADYLRDSTDLPPNSIVLTFDDAYRRFHDEIFPVLKRYEAPATVFVPTAAIDDQDVLWFNKVKALIMRPITSAAQASRPCPHSRDGSATGILKRARIHDDRRRAYREAISVLNACPLTERDDRLHELFKGARFDAGCLAEHAPLTWELIRNMHGPVQFGAHTATHPNLAALGWQPAAEEIAASKRRLEDELGVEVKHFAYPFGRTWNIGEQTPDLVRRAGFQTAVTTNRGACGKGDDPFMLPRIVCDGISNGRVLVTRLSNLWVCMST